MRLFESILSLTVSGLILSSDFLLTKGQTSLPSSNTHVGIKISIETNNLLLDTSSSQKAPYSEIHRQLKASPKKNGKKSKKADCKINHPKSPKSKKNISKKSNGGKKLKSSCFRVSSKAPVRLIPAPKTKKPVKVAKVSTVSNIARTSSLGTMVQVAFNGSLTFSRFPKPQSQDDSSAMIDVLTSAFNSILPDGSSVSLTNLSDKVWMNEAHTWNKTNRTLLRFTTLSHPVECTGVSCIQVGEKLYNETTQSLQQSVMNASLISAIHSQALIYQVVGIKYVRVNPKSLRFGNYKLVANQNEPLSQYSITSSSWRQKSDCAYTVFMFAFYSCSLLWF